MSRKLHRRQNKGFTLVELAIVGGIITTLAAIAIPMFRTSMYAARDTERTEITSSIERMMRDYYNNNYQYPLVNQPCTLVTGGSNCAPMEPTVPIGTKALWTDGLQGWTQINFKADGQAYTYRYSFATLNSTGNASGLLDEAILYASADLDADGNPSLYTTTLLDGSVIDDEWNSQW